MTIEELMAREAIRDTLAIASRSGDHLLVDDYVACFTPDGVLEYGDQLYKAGRDQIRTWIERASRNAEKRGLVRHSVTSTCITLQGAPEAPKSAEVRSYYQVYTRIGPDHFGWYDDRFVPFDGRWLLAHRIVGVDWMSDSSTARS